MAREITNTRPKIAYQYPVYTKPSSKVDYGKVEVIPAVGEVIQDRFQARPYFEYGKSPPKNEDAATYAPAKPVTAAPVRQAPPPSPSSFSAVFNVAPQTLKPPVDLYTSPFNSYNPPPLQPDNFKDSYPPSDSYVVAPKPSMESSTFGPPLAPPDVSSNVDTSSKVVDAPPSAHASYDGPPNFPPKSEDDIYYPAGVPHDDHHHHHHDEDHKGPSAMDEAPEDMMGGSPSMMPQQMIDHPKDMGDTSLSDHGNGFPHYLYDNLHYDHHVYEEIPHTTTPAPVKEDKRVSTTNYSFYYLGRKLWYIPLYFSIYFMVYVTFLILKAIARHKVEYKNNWVAANSRNGREMTFGQIEAVDDIHRNVGVAIDRVSRSYAAMAMK